MYNSVHVLNKDVYFGESEILHFFCTYLIAKYYCDSASLSGANNVTA